ncbi:MAG: multidrug efflux MFS transporter [Enterococcus sp.]|uniref:MDR family MFS transporter n=1 Tax=Enterococcus sp. TaxID=35783 RepID=UPI0026479E85|nr:MDR family MFS transporter [Enterococcus sp.]MDN6002993.1 multidrug efflux MFS transporter [Enterococcus sp.]MDN6216253.1 multidrug efflux MFS transporter [Enterococcus sp.]MDN6517646.1 multidrug efflux MFS transporter [Enterococcus sp.]MDN6561419.1 multidrug efflux MFS transporter [Enterococcus sp.]MDN6583301.1 multidrug efflux MFS transporter [Enterococcus sp.]
MATKQTKRLFLTLLLGSFTMFLNQTLLNTAYPSLMKDLSVSTDYVQWLTTGFLLVTAVVIPLSGWLLHQMNTKYLYSLSQVIFLAGTILCSVAGSFSQLLFGRVIQAIGVGIAMPLFQTVLLYLSPKNKRGTIMGIAGIVIGLAPAIGPSLSGFILTKYDWHVLFLMLVPIILVVLILTICFMQPVLPIRRTKLDCLSVIESSLGLGLLLYGLSLISAKHANKVLLGASIVLGSVFIYRFVRRQKKLANPFLSLEPFKQKEYVISCILLAIANMAMISFEMVIPMYIQNIRALSPLESGLSLLPGALVLGIMSPISGKLFDKYGAKGLSIVGMSFLTVFTFLFVFIQATTPMVLIITFYAFRLFGISMVLMPVTTFGMNALPNTELGDASVINKTTKQVASSLGTAVMISVMTLITNTSSPSKTLLAGYHGSFYVASFFCIIALVLSFKLPKHAA